MVHQITLRDKLRLSQVGKANLVLIMFTYDFRKMEKLFQTVETGKYTNWIYILNIYSFTGYCWTATTCIHITHGQELRPGNRVNKKLVVVTSVALQWPCCQSEPIQVRHQITPVFDLCHNKNMEIPQHAFSLGHPFDFSQRPNILAYPSAY